jgi:NAD(P)-dependent dehydrogenase (short-subunit alcohol dehydrogenase family)
MPSVLVTGAGRGIGLAITEHMSRRGWDVYATARSSDALQSLGRIPNVHAIPLDITDRAAIAALPDLLSAELNGVVNNAGIVVNGPVEGLALDDLTRQFDVNVISQIAVTQAVLPKIRASHGRVLFISSVSGLFTTPGTGAYNCIEVRDRVPGRCTPYGTAAVEDSGLTDRARTDPHRSLDRSGQRA